MPIENPQPKLFGLAVEFTTPQALLQAARTVRAQGYQHLEAYSPFPIEGLPEILDFPRTPISPIVLAGGIGGGVLGFFMLWYANVISYPWNIGGRPPNSWPAFIPITFEMTILGAALAAFFSVILLNRFPQLHHPLFNLPNFHLATRDRFFLCIESTDPQFDSYRTRLLLEDLNALSIMEVRE
jgi:hypothetical protein